MIIMTGICSLCDDGKEKRLAKKRPSLCGYHYTSEQRKKSALKNKDKPKKVYQLKRTPLTYKRKPTGEGKIFNEIWNERPHKSFLNDEDIPFFDVSCFAHVLSKAQNKFYKFKLHKPAIILLTREQHYDYDFTLHSELKKLPEWDKVFKLAEELKQEYQQLYGKS